MVGQRGLNAALVGGICVGVVAAAVHASMAAYSHESAVAAIVDGRRIYQRDVDARIAMSLARLEADMFNLRLRTLRRMIDEDLLARGGAESGSRRDDGTGSGAAWRRSPGGNDGASEEETKARMRLQRLRAKADVQTFVRPGLGQPVEIDSGGPSLGPADAAVTIVQFSDVQCVFCRAMQPALEGIVKRSARVRMVYRHFPLDVLHPTAVTAAHVGWCAHEQGRFWEFQRLAFATSGAFTESRLSELSRRSRLDTDALQRCLSSGRAQAGVQADLAAGERLGVVSTPVLLVNGKLLVGYVDAEVLGRIVDAELEAVLGTPTAAAH